MKWRITFKTSRFAQVESETRKRDLTHKLQSIQPLPVSLALSNPALGTIEAIITFEVDAESNFAACQELERIRDQLESEDFSKHRFWSENPVPAK